MAKSSKRYLEVDPWVIREDGFHPERSQASESIFALANEFAGVRGAFEEDYSGKTMIAAMDHPDADFRASTLQHIAPVISSAITSNAFENEPTDSV